MAQEIDKTPEIKESVVGVGVFIVTPDNRLLTLEELTTKRVTGKIAGMRSLPMETVEAGETHEQAIERLFQEEVVVDWISASQTRILLCKAQLTPGVWLYSYLICVPETLTVGIGTDGGKVANPSWINTEDILSSQPSERRFRPGVRETIKSYLDWLAKKGNSFHPKVYFNCEDEVPQEVFDRLEREAMQTAVLSQPSYSA